MALAAVVTAAGAAPPASAHDGLVASTPTAGETVDALDAVTLTFSDTLLNLGGMGNAFTIQVVSADGRFYTDGCVTLDGASVSAPVRMGGAGRYDVRWQVVSSDGHPTSGEYAFDYLPPAGTAVAPGFTSAPDCGVAGETGTPSADPADLPPSSSDVGSLLVGLSIGVAAIGITAALAVFFVRRSRARG